MFFFESGWNNVKSFEQFSQQVRVNTDTNIDTAALLRMALCEILDLRREEVGSEIFTFLEFY